MRSVSLLLVLGYLYISCHANPEPDLIVEIFRHGIRGPHNASYDKSYGNFYSELMPPGDRQHYILGAALKQTYPNIFKSYNASELYVRTTQDDRTIESALAQLYGIFKGQGPNLPDNYPAEIAVPPFDQASIDEQLQNLKGINAAIPGNYLPMPVHMLTAVDDFLLQPYENCKETTAIAANHWNDSTVQEVWAKLSTTRANVLAAGVQFKDIKQFKLLADTVLCDAGNQIPLPGNLDPSGQDAANLIFFQNWYDVYPTMSESIQPQMYSVPMMTSISELFTAKKAGTTPLKAVLYGVKESMMVTILTVFGVVNVDCLRKNWEFSLTNSPDPLPYPDCIYPGFAANVIMEYYNTANPYVIWKYNGKIFPVCGQDQCPLDQFTALVTKFTGGVDVPAYQSWCNSASTAQKNGKTEDTETNNKKVPKSDDSTNKSAFKAMGAEMIDVSVFSGLSNLAKGLLVLITVLSVSLIIVIRKIIDSKKDFVKEFNGKSMPLVINQRV